jgi:hypothetical protein
MHPSQPFESDSYVLILRPRVLYELLGKEKSQNWQKEWYQKWKENTYVNLFQGKFQVHLESISDSAFLFSVHASGDKSLDVKPGFYEVRIISDGINDSWDLFAGNFFWHLSRVTTNGGFARCTWPLRLGDR